MHFQTSSTGTVVQDKIKMVIAYIHRRFGAMLLL